MKTLQSDIPCWRRFKKDKVSVRAFTNVTTTNAGWVIINVRTDEEKHECSRFMLEPKEAKELASRLRRAASIDAQVEAALKNPLC